MLTALDGLDGLTPPVTCARNNERGLRMTARATNSLHAVVNPYVAQPSLPARVCGSPNTGTQYSSTTTYRYSCQLAWTNAHAADTMHMFAIPNT